MKQFTSIFLFCCVFLACSISDTKTVNEGINPNSGDLITSTDSLSFPESWLGNWVGDLEIFKDNQKMQSIPMELELLAVDTAENYIWAIIYGEDKEAGRRPYELEILNREKGQFRVDEKNTIKLETYLFGNKLMSWYEVMGNQILSIYEKKGEEMIFEIIFGNSEPISITGDQQFEGEAIPAVKTFPIGGYQRAVLKRKK